MSTEGWFLRTDTGEYFPIQEHRLWIEEPENARKVGVPECVIATYSEWRGRDRVHFLSWLLKNCPHLCRVRNHGVFQTFEAWRVTRNIQQAIHGMCQKIGVGECLLLVIVELRPGGREYREFWLSFDKKIRTGQRLQAVNGDER